jgi:hypothetical protein
MPGAGASGGVGETAAAAAAGGGMAVGGAGGGVEGGCWLEGVEEARGAALRWQQQGIKQELEDMKLQVRPEPGA